jgi:2-phospho-L-lactate/phosphoenolpyruvate guanylyltransferase
VLAIVPVKGREGSKSRLAPLLSDEERIRLVTAMLGDVVDACRDAEAVDAVLVVTPDPSVVPQGVEVLTDDGVGHAEAIATALADPRAAEGVLVVMADCPLVQPESLNALVEAARPVALVPSGDGGTNAVALKPGDALEPAFGIDGSAGVTIERARAAGYEPAVLHDPLLALDVDCPEDVARFHELILASAR